jgi:nucleotide-binding universal stress UspA family protein
MAAHRSKQAARGSATMAHLVLGGIVFLTTLILVMIRPRGIPEAVVAGAGALLMVVLGFVGPTEALAVLAGEWNVFEFFLGLMLISAIAARAGLGAVTTQLMRGQPERVIVDLAAREVDLVVVGAREGVAVLPTGPESVGHVARFVLDHAPCNVLLVRR